MPNMKEVKNRIKSIENTKQITNAMQLVSFSKLKRAKESFKDAYIVEFDLTK